MDRSAPDRLLQCFNQAIESGESIQDIVSDNRDGRRAPEDPVSVGREEEELVPLFFVQGNA